MRAVNQVILVGNATRDDELRHTHSGKAVSTIRLVINRVVNGNEEPQFHSVACWDGLAKTTATYIRKVDPAGRPQYRTFQDEEGKERGVAVDVASDVQFLDRRKAGPDEDPPDEVA